VFGAGERGAGEEFDEVRGGFYREDGADGELVAGDFGDEKFFVRSWLCFRVERADLLTDVAAVKEAGFFDDFGERFWDFVTIFDSEIGDAFSGVYNAWGDDCFGGAGVDAFSTAAAGGERFRGV